MWKQLEKGEITKPELKRTRFKKFFEAIDFVCGEDPLTVNEYYLSLLGEGGNTLEGAVETVKTLHEEGYELHIITNGIAYVQEKRFDPSPLRPLFSDVFISEEIGAEKPSMKFFDTVAARIPDFLPADTLVIGDSLTSDIQGGINAGIDTCWFNRKGATAPADMPITYTVSALRDILPVVLGE